MRTTLTLDDDVADKLTRLSSAKKLPFRQVVNDVLRCGLAAPVRRPTGAVPFAVKPFSSTFRPGVDQMKLNQLVDDLEAVRPSTRRSRKSR